MNLQWSCVTNNQSISCLHSLRLTIPSITIPKSTNFHPLLFRRLSRRSGHIALTLWRTSCMSWGPGATVTHTHTHIQGLNDAKMKHKQKLFVVSFKLFIWVTLLDLPKSSGPGILASPIRILMHSAKELIFASKEQAQNISLIHTMLSRLQDLYSLLKVNRKSHWNITWLVYFLLKAKDTASEISHV